MATRVKEIRQSRGLQQHKLGQVLDLPQSRISDIERGKRKVTLEEGVKLAKFLNVRVEDLIAGNNSP